MNPKISIVMPYYNRIELLYFTLRTFECSSYAKHTEIICVDDASKPALAAKQLLGKFKLNFRVITMDAEEKLAKGNVCPCVPFNVGFEAAQGEVIVLQSPECFHYGDVLKHVAEHVDESNYIVYSVKSIHQKLTKVLYRSKDLSPAELNNNIVRDMSSTLSQKSGWYNHPRWNPTAYHFISAITRKNLIDMLGGFDQRYATGYCFDDNEILERIRRSPLEIQNIDPSECCGVHQFHPKFSLPMGNKDPLWKQNYSLFHSKTKKEKGWTANIY